MRIGIIYLGRRGSGGPISLELATHLSQQASLFALLSEQAESLAAWQQSGLESFCVPTYRNLPGALAAWLNQAGLRRLSGLVRSREPDVLIYPMFYTLNPFLQAHLAGIPSLVAVHDPVPHPGAADYVFSLLESWSIRQATRCLLFSQKFVPDLQQRGVRPERIDVVPHGELSYYRRCRQDLEAAPADETTLLFFGRITAYKGLDVLLKAYAQVSQVHPVKLQLVGAGDIQPYLPLLKGLAEVEMVNRWVDELEVGAYFQRAQIVVLPYTSASQSGVLAIAAGFAKPVIATRVGGIPEQIKDGETGLLVEPNSVEQLAGAILQLLETPQLGARLGKNLFDDFQLHRNWAAIARVVYSACEKAIQDKDA